MLIGGALGSASRCTNASNRVLLAFETNCCLKPCIDSKCYSCHTKPLPEWELKSFGLCNGNHIPPLHVSNGLHDDDDDDAFDRRVNRINYLLDTLDTVEEGLKHDELLHIMDRNFTTGFVAYNYRGLKILLENMDDGTNICPASWL